MCKVPPKHKPQVPEQLCPQGNIVLHFFGHNISYFFVEQITSTVCLHDNLRVTISLQNSDEHCS